MQTEFEATFLNIAKDKIRSKLEAAGGKLVKSEYLQKRYVFDFPTKDMNKWLRVRDEGDKVTMSIKASGTSNIEDQQELMLIVDSFDNAAKFIEELGFKKNAYQENKRETWKLDKAEIDIDEWPFLEPFVEIEASSEQEVKTTAEKLGFDYSQAIFGSTDHLYELKYNVSFRERILEGTGLLKFDMENPFL